MGDSGPSLMISTFGQKGLHQGAPRFHMLDPKNVVLLVVWRHVLGFTLRTPRFVAVTFPRSVLERQLSTCGQPTIQ